MHYCKYQYFLLIVISGFIFLSCDGDSVLEPDFDQVVVQAYLYAGLPVQDVRLRQTLPLGSEETEAPPINDAIVRLKKGEQTVVLLPSAGDSGYYHYAGNDLSVEAGESFTIEVDYFGETASGETVVPGAPLNVKKNTGTLFIPETFSPREFEFDSTRHQISITWDGESENLYFVSYVNIEENPEEVVSGFGGGGGPGGPGGPGVKFNGPRAFISAPSGRTEYTIRFMDITHYGTHQVTVYQVNQEYADLYISRQQDSRDLNEPLTNIRNGLGVFSAFSGVTKTFEAVKE